MKTILILTGSPRMGGNSDLMAEVFAKGAEGAGHTVHRFDTGRLTIHGCRACDKCWLADEVCIQKDDFHKIAEVIPKADVIVFASPLYYYDMSAQMKAAIDRLYGFCAENRLHSMNIKEYVLMMCGETSHIEDFDPVKKIFGEIAHFLKWQEKGSLIAVSACDKGDIKSDILKRAEELGRSIR